MAGCLAEPDSAPPRVNGICLVCHFIEARGLRCREALTQTAHVQMEIVMALLLLVPPVAEEQLHEALDCGAVQA